MKVHHHLIKYNLPEKQAKSAEDCICFHMMKDNTNQLFADGRHPQGQHVLNLNLAPSERAIVLGIEVLYYTNDTKTLIEMVLDLKFAQPPPAGGLGSGGGRNTSSHPDFTGLVRFILEPGHKGQVAKVNRKLYEPNFINLGFNVLPFAGQEESILNARSFAVASADSFIQHDYELFGRSDPFIVFIIENRKHFNWLCQSDILLCKDNIHYKVQKDALQRVRAFFREAIFPLFKYTQQSSFSLTWKALSQHVVDECSDYEDEVLQNDGFSMVVVMLKVDYVVIKPDLAQFYYEQMEIK